MMKKSAAVTLSLRVKPEVKQCLDKLAEATGRSKSFLAGEALQDYLAQQTWQVEEIQQAMAKADQPDAKWVKHDTVAAWLKSWGTSDEGGSPL